MTALICLCTSAGSSTTYWPTSHAESQVLLLLLLLAFSCQLRTPPTTAAMDAYSIQQKLVMAV
jgi:hypothetical protein